MSGVGATPLCVTCGRLATYVYDNRHRYCDQHPPKIIREMQAGPAPFNDLLRRIDQMEQRRHFPISKDLT